MIDPATCRAARGLLNWSQQQLADEANIGLSTVKKFESGRTTLMANNLAAIRRTLENAGVVLVAQDEGGPGALLTRLKRLVYMPGEGLQFEVHYADLGLEEPDNDFDIWFRLDESAIAALADKPIFNEEEAKKVARRNEARVIAATVKWIKRHGLSSPGGRPRVILPKDLR